MVDELTDFPDDFGEKSFSEFVVGNVDDQRRDALQDLSQGDVIRLRDQSWGNGRRGKGTMDISVY